MAQNPIIMSYDFLKKCEDFKNDLDKAKKISPDTTTELLAFQIGFATWLSKFIPNPIKTITSNISELGDGTIKDQDFIKSQDEKYNDELIKGVYSIIKKYNFTFDSTRDMKIIFDEKYIATIPKDTLHKFNLVQHFVSSAELVYKEIIELDISKKMADIEKHSKDFHDYSDNVQNLRIDFIVEPESYLGKVVQEFEENKKANEGLYKTPRKETTMSYTTSSFETHNNTPSPTCNASNKGGKINFVIMIPVIVCSIPLTGGGSASFCCIS